MQEKVSALSIPKGVAALPVLFHLSGVSKNVVQKGYFYRIIDISDFLVESS